MPDTVEGQPSTAPQSVAAGDAEGHPSSFGAYTVVSALTDGRFGPLWLARGPDDSSVVVRSFTIPLSDAQRDRLFAALTTLCQRPLDHPSIARPIAAGLQDGRPYLVHAYLPGIPLAELIRTTGPLALSDVIVRLTYLAGALDFADAAGVLHGSLGLQDVIFSDDNTGLSGLGLVQALETAGVDGFHARREDDVAALIAIARQLLGAGVSPAVAAVLDGPPPATALGFASALQGTLPVQAAVAAPPVEEIEEPQTEPAAISPEPGEPSGHPIEVAAPARAAGDPFDIPLRDQNPLTLFDAEPQRFEAAPAPEHLEEAPRFTMDEPVVAPRPMFGATEDPPVAVPAKRGSRGWLMTAAVALMLGIAAGFASGFFVGRDTTAAPPATVPAAAPAATDGQSYSDAEVNEPKPADSITSKPLPPLPADAPPAAASPSDSGPVATTPPAPNAIAPNATEPPRGAAPSTAAGSSRAGAREGTAPSTPPPSTTRAAREQPATRPPSGPAAMRVDSLPAGAQVFVDGRSVGYTPMVVGELMPGTHSIRMQLPGYRPFVTAVTLGPGARERVAASLEQ